jgi:uncharacterized protein (DUF983 family)
VHAVIWIPMTLLGTIVLLRPLKGLMVGFQFRYRAVDEPTKPGAT